MTETEAKSETIQCGNVVQLLSGGPLMTVMMTMKIQIRKGTEQPTAKLDEEKVRYIRRRVKAEGKAIYGELAAELGVSASVIGNVARYQSWRWVTDRPGEEVELAYIELKGKAPRGRPRRKRR